MASEIHTGDSKALPERLFASQNNRDQAAKLFKHAHKAAETRNFDYAVELYVNGLKLWPDAVEEGLRKLRVVATARMLEGGKPPGFMAARKYPTNTKDPLQNLNNALHLYGLHPNNLSNLELILQLAAKVHCDRVAEWVAPLLAEGYNSAKKLSANHYLATCDALDRTAELAGKFNNEVWALAILQAYIAIAQMWEAQYSDSSDAQRARSAASSKQAIVKGHFDKADGFTDSLKNAEAQRDAQDRDRGIHTTDRHRVLIERARQDWKAHPNEASKLRELVVLLSRTETEADEAEAIQLLEEEYKSSEQYAFKQRADDIRIRQLVREHRDLAAQAKIAPDDKALQAKAKEAEQRILSLETAVYEDRQRHYPTDLRVKYHLGLRYFQAGRYDDAIPLFQLSLMDGRTRLESMLYIGRSFFNKKFYDQSVGTLERASREPTATGALFLELNYWWARALEATDSLSEARRVYGHLIQLDYNFRDARQRLERLVSDEQK